MSLWSAANVCDIVGCVCGTGGLVLLGAAAVVSTECAQMCRSLVGTPWAREVKRDHVLWCFMYCREMAFLNQGDCLVCVCVRACDTGEGKPV